MPNDRHDFRPTPPLPKYGTPNLSYPSLLPEDFPVIVEEVPIKAGSYEPLEYYTPHPKMAVALLVEQGEVKGDSNTVNARRVYEVLPGPYEFSFRYDNALGTVHVQKRPIKATEAGPAIGAATSLTTYEPRGDSMVVSIQTIETWALPGPIQHDTRDDADLGPVVISRQAVAYDVNNVSVVNGTTRTSYEPKDGSAFISWKVIETWSTTPTKKGQEYEKRLGLLFPFTEQEQTFDNATTGAPALGNAHTEVIPNDAHSSRVRVYDQTAANTALAGYVYGTQDNIRVLLPDVLLAIGIQYNVTTGEGSEGSSSALSDGGAAVPLGLGLPASATSSMTITAAPLLTMKQFWGAENTPAMKYVFFVNGGFTEADLLTRLGTITGGAVLAWPSFKPQDQMLAIHSPQMSLSGHADARRYVSQTSGGAITAIVTDTVGKSMETGGSSSTLHVPPCLHAHLIIANPTLQRTLDVTATSAITPGIGTVIPAVTVTAAVPTQTLTASITPTELLATAPAAVPSTGAYLYNNYQTEKFDAENTEVTAWVIDMSYFLSYTIAASPNTVGWGTVAGVGEYNLGDTVTLVATALSGHSFVHWLEEVTTVSTSATFTFTAAADRVLVAVFS